MLHDKCDFDPTHRAVEAANSSRDQADDGLLTDLLRRHEGVTCLEEEREVQRVATELVATRPHDWRGLFWLAYLETQVARRVSLASESDANSRPEDRRRLLHRARQHLDRAQLAHPSPSARDTSSFHALRALIHQLLLVSEETPSRRAQHQRALHEHLTSAVRIDPQNPSVWVMLGIDFVLTGDRDGDLAQLLAGHALLCRAGEALRSIPDRSRTTFFNAEWVPFWLAQVEKMLRAARERSQAREAVDTPGRGRAFPRRP